MRAEQGRGDAHPPEPHRRAVLFDAYPHVYAGAQRIDHLLAQRLPDRGWRLTTITPGPGPFPSRLVADRLPVEILQAPPALDRYGRTTRGLRRARAVTALPRYWYRMLRVLGRLDPQVVHVTDQRGMALAGLPARLSGARLVWHIHAIDRNRVLTWIGACLAHCTLVPSRTVVAQMPGLARSRDLRVVGNVVLASARRDRPVDLAASPVIASVARLHPDKGLDLLIEALALVRRQIPTATVRILGGPQEGFEDLAPELEALAVSLGVGDAVELLGFVERTEHVVAAARCYVQPARERTEILPLAVLEAMALGVPVVATDVGALRAVLQNDGTGLLVPPEDIGALADAIVRILRDAGLANRLRRAAFALMSDPRFDEASMVERVLAAYAGISRDG